MPLLSKVNIKKNLGKIKSNIDQAAYEVGRDPNEVRILAVTKGQPLSYIEMAIDCGQKLFGENRVQEAQKKYKDIGSNIELHLIGHLQRNKAKIASQLFCCVQSIDKLVTAECLNQYAQEYKRQIDILFEINTSGEISKFGFKNKEDLFSVFEKMILLKGLNIRGLMTVGPFTDDEKRIQTAFASLRELFLRIKREYKFDNFNILSMGMSHDYIIAIKQGATLIRIGTAIFGPRVYY